MQHEDKINHIMTERRARIVAGNTPETADDKFRMENKDLLRFADEMMTDHVQAERKEKNIYNENEFDRHAGINMEAVRTRDYIRWLEDSNNRIKDKKLLINRSPIDSN
jgi:hypothetical protein